MDIMKEFLNTTGKWKTFQFQRSVVRCDNGVVMTRHAQALHTHLQNLK